MNHIQTTHKQGFTLVESVIGILLFGLMSLGVSFITVMAMKISHQNVYKTSAYSVMQGYMEQIKSLDSESLSRALSGETPSNPTSLQVLQTRSISLLSDHVGVDQIDDWLVPNNLNPGSLSDTMDVINLKRVVIDVDEESGENKMMDIWVDVEIHKLTSGPGEVYLIDLQYIYNLPLLHGAEKLTKTVFTREDSRDYTTSSESIYHNPTVNHGRMQMITTLLNYETL